MLQSLVELVAHYGYVIVALLVFAESIGLPLPGETALLTAAALAARGTLSLTGVIVSAAVGTILGGTGAYWIGRRGGATLLLRHGRWIRVTPEKLQRAGVFFERHGAATVFFGRWIALLRMFAGFLAGAAAMPFGRFSLVNAFGGIVWSAFFGAIGFVFGRNLPRLIAYLGRASLALALFVALAAGVAIAARWLMLNRTAVAAAVGRAWTRFGEAAPLRGMRRSHPRLWGMVVTRFASGEYLLLHLAVGFVVSAAALGIFAAVTEDVVVGDPLTVFDVVLAGRLAASLAPGAHHALRAVAALGSTPAMTFVFLLGAVPLAIRRSWLALATWCAAFAGAAMLDALLRVAIHRVRPVAAVPAPLGGVPGFPSGFAAGTLVGYGMLAHALFRWCRRADLRALAITGAVALVLAIGMSRLTLGSRFFSSQVAGYAAGLLWLASCISGVELARGREGAMSG